jgi:hypothetical protein
MRRPRVDLEEKHEPRAATSAGTQSYPWKGIGMACESALTSAAIEKLPFAGIVPADQFRPVPLVEIRPACARSCRSLTCLTACDPPGGEREIEVLLLIPALRRWPAAVKGKIPHRGSPRSKMTAFMLLHVRVAPRFHREAWQNRSVSSGGPQRRPPMPGASYRRLHTL